MGHTETENKCRSVNCPGACCKNQFANMNEDQFAKFSDGISHTIEFVNKDTLIALSLLMMMKKPFTRDGIFVNQDIHPMTGKPHYFMIIVGPCPHLLDSFNCEIYDTRPDSCRKVLFAGLQCADHRQLIQLEPLPQSGNTSYPL